MRGSGKLTEIQVVLSYAFATVLNPFAIFRLKLQHEAGVY